MCQSNIQTQPLTYMSLITNFGCHYTCPYCIVKNTGISIPQTTLESLTNLKKSIITHQANALSISGGGDPLHNYPHTRPIYEEIFKIASELNLYLELHTSYLSLNYFFDYHKFNRIVYHLRSYSQLKHIKRYGTETVRVVFVVTESFSPSLIDQIAQFVSESTEIDELSFRQMVDEDYNTTDYCYEYLKSGHQKSWWYIEQGDYNLYYCDNRVSFKYSDFLQSQNK